ncbi:chitin deacetylase [Mortierella sp. GBA30]|nr:chitin deacetylase [Mortierella sp. GBA30]
MVKLFTSSIAVLVLAATAKAQSSAPAPAPSIVPSNYPAVNAIPPTNSPEVIAWLKEIDLTGAPQIALHTGQPPVCPKTIDPNECYWTCDGCSADDIVACGRANTWGLTFDDGPSTATPTLLDYLGKNKLSATFFLIGSNVIQYPATVQRELKEGHHLASHTWSHHALTTLTNEQIVAEMKWTEKAVLEATGVKLKYMRPPYGDINNRVRFVLKKLGYIPVDWTGDAFDTNDWKLDEKQITEAQVIDHFSKSLDTYAASNNKTKGFYCLEHDLSMNTVGAAQKLIPLGLAKNITFANVGVCESDANPYQGGSAPVVSSTQSGTVSTATGSASPSGATGKSTVSPTTKNTNGAEKAAGSVLAMAAVAAVAGLVLA